MYNLIRSELAIKLVGNEGDSKPLTLTDHGFREGSEEQVSVSTEDVGPLRSVILINESDEQYRCDHIRIEKGGSIWNFECLKPIKCNKKKPQTCRGAFPITKIITYKVTVKTSFVEGSGTNEEIYINFVGTKTKSPMKLLAARGFDQGSLVTNSVDTVDVGSLFEIILNINGFDNWQPEEIIVKKPSDSGEEEKVFKFNEEDKLTDPQKPLTKKLPRNVASQEDSNNNDRDTDSLLNFDDQQSKVISSYSTRSDKVRLH